MPEGPVPVNNNLELAMSEPLKTHASGVFQSDVIIRTAIRAALDDLVENPWLLRYAFAGLAQDDLTKDVYGEAEVDKAVEWFQNQNISVGLNINPNEIKFPFISITLLASNEVEAEGTLGDVHYRTQEDNDWSWPSVAGPLDVASYEAATGTLAFNAAQIPVSVVLAPGMVVVTRTGAQYTILEVVDNATVQVAPGTIADFGRCQVKPSRPAWVTTLESAVFRETYAVGCHCDSEPIHLVYLHSVVVFALLRYKQALIEARGFERTTLTSTDLRRDEQLLPEMLYNRYVQISGAVRQSWPKLVSRKVTAALVDPVPSVGTGPASPVVVDDPFQDFADQDALAFVAPKPQK